MIEKELRIFDDNGTFPFLHLYTTTNTDNLTALDRCMELMAEDPERQRRRQYVLKEKEKISKAQEWLATARKSEDDADTAGGGFDAFVKPQPDDD